MWKNKISSLVLATILVSSTISIIPLYQAGASTGTTLYVGGNGLGNYTTLQSAINAASNGDTVFVYKGLYHENVILNKSISLLGENKNITRIDGNKSTNVVTLLADEIKLSGFTITMYMNNSGGPYSSSFTSNTITTGNAATYKNDSGIYIYKSRNNTITDNIVTGNSHYGINLDSSSTNNTLMDNIITGNTHYGIKLDPSSTHNTIRGNTITYNNWYGLYLESYNNNITGNTITNNDDGIYFMSSNNTIVGNTIANNGNGIYLYIGISPSLNKGTIIGNTITDNTITNNTNGVYLYFDPFCPYCKDSTLTANTITKNIITYNTYGIDLFSSPNTTITDNIITYNTYGIALSYSSNNTTITGNLISNNANGIDLYQSGNNTIYHNNFINNSLHVTTSSSETINTWDNGYPNGGNYWDTYIGIDVDGDHIGDTPYPIPGIDNLDRYPLTIPYKLLLNQPPTCTLLVSPPSGTVPLTVTFTLTANDPDGTITTWTLDTDTDGKPDYNGTGTPPSMQQHIYTNTGTYTAKFMVTDNQNSTVSGSTIIMVNQVAPQNKAPIAEYTPSLQNPTTQDIIHFTDTSTDSDGELVNWTWNFGDGNQSYLQHPTHHYTTEGTYTVTLQVKDDNGTINSTSHELVVTTIEYTQYNLIITIQPSYGGTVTLSPPGGIYTGGVLVTATAVASTGYEFSHWSGNITVNATILSIHILMNSNKTLTAHFEGHNVSPMANFTYAIDGLKVTFMDNSTDANGHITEWHWSFGDDTASTLTNPTHTYKEEGQYTVALTITDTNGDTDTHSKIITVTAGEDGNGTPGFEMVLLVIALLSLIIIVRKKR